MKNTSSSFYEGFEKVLKTFEEIPQIREEEEKKRQEIKNLSFNWVF